MNQVIRYPSLKTILMVEKVLKTAVVMVNCKELKRKSPNKIIHQTPNLILKYMEDCGLIFDSHKGILWIYNPRPRLRKAIEKEEYNT